jgi:hypothetical protein
LWKQKFPNGKEAPKHKDFTLNPVTESTEDSVKQLNLRDDVENDIIMTIRNKHNFAKPNGRQGGKQGFAPSTTRSVM